MKNRQLDSEIRIKGYLAVIACPCGKSANEIKTLLESEPVHQGTVHLIFFCDGVLPGIYLVLYSCK